MNTQPLPASSPGELAEAFGLVLETLLDRGIPLEEAVSTFEAKYLERALERYGGSLQQAAQALGIHRNTLREKLRRFGLR